MTKKFIFSLIARKPYLAYKTLRISLKIVKNKYYFKLQLEIYIKTV